MLCQNKYTQSIISCPFMIQINPSHILTCCLRSVLIVSIPILFSSIASFSLLFCLLQYAEQIKLGTDYYGWCAIDVCFPCPYIKSSSYYNSGVSDQYLNIFNVCRWRSRKQAKGIFAGWKLDLSISSWCITLLSNRT